MATDNKGLEWQVRTWNQMADRYLRENAPRMAPVVEAVVARAKLAPGEHVLDIGTGTGGVPELALPLVGPNGWVVGIDVSPEMLELARRQLSSRGFTNVAWQEAPAESLPATNAEFDVVLASLSMMYVIDRQAAANEIARVLRSGGRFVAAVWAGPDQCDLVRFQQIAGRFAGPPPVAGVGPGALADAGSFLQQLSSAGIVAQVETEILGFSVDSFAQAWAVFAGVTTATLTSERQQLAKDAVRAAMWPDGEAPRQFRNLTQFIVGRKST
jgi:SAM-dependent methyltransferase